FEDQGLKAFTLCRRLNADPGTKFADFTTRTVRITREAAAAPMPDQQMTEKGPLVLGDELHQVFLDLFRGFLGGQVEPSGEAGDVSIDHDTAIDVESVAQNNIGSFAADSA